MVGGADTGQQLLRAGLIDELEISIMPVLLGGGLRLFEHLGRAPIRLERLTVATSPIRTDIGFRVVRGSAEPQPDGVNAYPYRAPTGH